MWKIARSTCTCSVDHLSLTHTSCYTAMSNTIGTPSSPVSQLSSLCQAYYWLVQGSGLMLPDKPEGVTGRGCGRLGHHRMHEGKQHGEGQTPSEEAGELGPTMRVVRQSRTARPSQ